MSKYLDRLQALRRELLRRRLDGFVVPLTDEHMSEYVADYAKRLAWLTGFEGSAGWAVVLQNTAAIFVDGRYTLQAHQQVNSEYWSVQSLSQTPVTAWLHDHAAPGACIGYDPYLHTKRWVNEARSALKTGSELVAVDTNPVDAVWMDRPALPCSKMMVHPAQFAGKPATDKIHDVANWLAKNEVDALVLTALDSIAWLLNVRGKDIAHTPVVLAYALVHVDGTVDLFVEREKLTDEVVEHLGSAVRVHARAAFIAQLGTLAQMRIAVDPERAVAAVLHALEAAGTLVIEHRDPVVLLKAVKNDTEIAGHRAAQVRDGAALTRFLHWLSTEGTNGKTTDLAAAAQLYRFRQQTGKLLDLSFETISGFGPNAAIVHYRGAEETSRLLTPGSLYLVDSGGQYIDGTTDVTRTIAIGTATAEMRERFTLVLKGHIALATALFPSGTRGGQLDALARQHLWAAGLDYAHGTGHGVGAYLCVHEGPQQITCARDGSEPLAPGMIVSNEPGYYKAGEYGIRIENLLLVTRRQVVGAEREMLGFETLTFAPLDRSLIDTTMLTARERDWVDSYHRDVATIVGPQLEGAANAWLLDASRPLD